MSPQSPFCHLCGWWHLGYPSQDHPPLKLAECDVCWQPELRQEHVQQPPPDPAGPADAQPREGAS